MVRLPASAANAAAMRVRRGVRGLLAVAVIAAVTACAPVAPPAPSGAPSAPTTGPSPGGSPSPGATQTPSAPVLDPQGTAADNLPLFAAVTGAVWATEDRVSGRAYIDALVAAGFDKSAMQVTEDRSTVGNPAESIQFSVRWGDQCLIGQVGPATGDPVTVVVPVVAEGTCLIGQTRPIDW